jgi:hypothetical protein
VNSVFRHPVSNGSTVRSTVDRCVDCAYFHNDATTIERAFPGLAAMGSAFADVRAYDGLCGRHGIYLAFSDGCAEFKRSGVGREQDPVQ